MREDSCLSLLAKLQISRVELQLNDGLGMLEHVVLFEPDIGVRPRRDLLWLASVLWIEFFDREIGRQQLILSWDGYFQVVHLKNIGRLSDCTIEFLGHI